MRRAFGKTIVKLAEKDEKIILISGDVEQEMDEYKKKFPRRYINAGRRRHFQGRTDVSSAQKYSSLISRVFFSTCLSNYSFLYLISMLLR